MSEAPTAPAETAEPAIEVAGTTIAVTKKARAAFDQDQVNALHLGAPAGTPTAVFHKFLELAARYELDPFANQIWLANMRGANGGPGSIVVLVGRDGYLTVANRQADFIDVDSDVVCENDTFKVVRDGDGRTVHHEYEHPSKRGAPVGAYAVLRRHNKPDRYFYASKAEYGKDASKSAWKYVSAMLVKCAISYVLRTTYTISGAVPFDEMQAGAQFTTDGQPVPEAERTPEVFPMPTELHELVERAFKIDQTAFRSKDVFARLPGDPETDSYKVAVKQLCTEIEEWLAEQGEVDAEAEEVVDAEPVGPHILNEEELAAKWDDDEDWRSSVAPMISMRQGYAADLQAVRDADDDDTAILKSLESIEADLAGYGVPAEWMPAGHTAA